MVTADGDYSRVGVALGEKYMAVLGDPVGLVPRGVEVRVLRGRIGEMAGKVKGFIIEAMV